jgi:hypothetical protein
LHPDQTVFEMAEEVLERQARYLADQTGQTFEKALEIVADTETGRQLRNWANGVHRHEKARDWKANMLWVYFPSSTLGLEPVVVEAEEILR